jgi:hypothetical protein
VQRSEEWVVGCQGQDPLLRHGALDVVVLNDDVLLQNLDGEHLNVKGGVVNAVGLVTALIVLPKLFNSVK